MLVGVVYMIKIFDWILRMFVNLILMILIVYV